MNNIPEYSIDGTLSNKEKLKKKIDIGRLAILIAAITLLIVAAIFILLTDTPDEVPPEIILKDVESNRIDETYKLDFFGDANDLIHPGSEGTFDFVVTNPHPQRILYDFEIEALYRGEPVSDFPIQYRVRMNNALLNTEEWLTIDQLDFSELTFLGESDQLITLEWRWLFEQGNDDLDTQYGIDNGDYSLVFHITAELLEEIY